MKREVSVREVMTPEVEVLHETNTLDEAARVLADRDIGSLVVCDQDERVCGILTDRDIVVNAIARGKDPRKTTIGEIATMEPVCVAPEMPVKGVAEVMARYRVRRLPVVSNGSVVGIVSQGDVARADPDRTGHMVSAISM